MDPLSGQRKFVLGLVVVAGIVIIIATLLVLATMNVAGPASAAETIKRTDRQVYLLGTSDDTQLFLDQLSNGTSTIVQINNIAQLPTNASDAILLIDGQWPLDQPNATYLKTSAIIAQLIINGTPVVIINGEDFVLQLAFEYLAADGYHLSHGSWTGGPGGLETHGYFYNQSTGSTINYGCGFTNWSQTSKALAVINAYNWGSDRVAGLQPR
jgi:hypothetical protein